MVYGENGLLLSLSRPPRAHNAFIETTATGGGQCRGWRAEKEESYSRSAACSKRCRLSVIVSILRSFRLNHSKYAIDLSELSLGSTMRTKFADPDDILNFTLTIEPDEGMYRGGSFNFSFAINQNFPHDPPKVKCMQKIYHPNIDLEGNVCLNILREDWKPVLNLNAVIVGLQVR